MQTKNSRKEEINVNQDELEASSEDYGNEDYDEEMNESEDDDDDDNDDDDDEDDDEDDDDEDDDEDDDDEDDDEDDSDDDDDDDDTDGDEADTVVKGNVTDNTNSQRTKSGAKHTVFDDDEDFENLPIPDSLASGPGPGLEDLEDTDEDSDAAPEEAVTTAVLEATIKQDKKLKEENKKAKLSIRDARKKTHERNKEQKEQKRQRLKVLESERLPEELLAAVEAEKAQQQVKRKVAIEKHEGKIKRFKNNNEESETESHRGVQVRAVIKEMKKYSTVMAKAADFRQQQLYGSDVPRRPSKDARMLKEKLTKSGKNKSVR